MSKNRHYAGKRHVAAAVLFAALGGLVTACGHPATKKECEEIFRRNAELTLREQNVTDKQEIQRWVEKARKDNPVEPCVGRRITDAEMSCIRSAETLKGLNACLE